MHTTERELGDLSNATKKSIIELIQKLNYSIKKLTWLNKPATYLTILKTHHCIRYIRKHALRLRFAPKFPTTRQLRDGKTYKVHDQRSTNDYRIECVLLCRT